MSSFTLPAAPPPDMDILTADLDRQQLVAVLRFFEVCVSCTDERTLHDAILALAAFMGYEFVLYAYMKHTYDKSGMVNFVNLSNPATWMEEYHQKGYLNGDPVRIELEARLQNEPGFTHSILWDAYDRPLSEREREIIRRRSHHGLKFGFSVFNNSLDKNAVFLISFARRDRQVEQPEQDIGRFIVPQLNWCRKRLDLLMLVGQLSRRERAVADWLVEGKTNWEIASILEVTESTVKFHVSNILRKLRVTNRLAAISILLAVRYLS